MSSHPGSTLNSAIELAEYLRDIKYQPEQVQDFYPTPGTLSTTMFYTGIDPRTMKEVYVPKSKGEKAMQRALLQYSAPRNYDLVHAALVEAGREDLIGFGPKCLIKPKDARGSLKSADAVFLRLFPRSKRRFGSAVNRVDKLGKAGIGKIPGIAYLVHLAAFRTIRIACRIQRTIILPVYQIFRAVQDNTAASCHRHIKPSRRDQNPVAFIFLIIKYIRITPVQLFI